MRYVARSGDFRTYPERGVLLTQHNLVLRLADLHSMEVRHASSQLPKHATDDRPDEAPFADERGRYLRHCAEHGAKAAVLKVKRNELPWIATRLDLNARDGVDMVMLSRIAQERQGLHGAVTRCAKVIDIGRPWLRFHGWWRKPP